MLLLTLMLSRIWMLTLLNCTPQADPVDFVRQGALVAMALVLMQQPEARVAPFRKQLAKFVADKHEEIMCRCVPVIAPCRAAECCLQTACRRQTLVPCDAPRLAEQQWQASAVRKKQGQRFGVLLTHGHACAQDGRHHGDGAAGRGRAQRGHRHALAQRLLPAHLHRRPRHLPAVLVRSTLRVAGLGGLLASDPQLGGRLCSAACLGLRHSSTLRSQTGGFCTPFQKYREWPVFDEEECEPACQRQHHDQAYSLPLC